MTRYRQVVMCPFCRRQDPTSPHGGAQMCGGSFLDTDHPGTVRMLLVELGDDGQPLAEDELCLAESRATYA